MVRSDNIIEMALFPIEVDHPAERRVLLSGVSWSTYTSLRESLGRAVRLTYLEGELEIMTVGRVHEVSRTMLSRLLELFCLERDIPLFGYGHETVRLEAEELGLEPDAWYNRGRAADIAQIAIEVVVTNPLIDKLEIYARLGVPEVWVFQAGELRILERHDEGYRRIETSKILPEVDVSRLVHHAMQEDQHAALVAFRAELRQ